MHKHAQMLTQIHTYPYMHSYTLINSHTQNAHVLIQNTYHACIYPCTFARLYAHTNTLTLTNSTLVDVPKGDL